MLMGLSGISLTALLFQIENNGVKVYTIGDCYPDPFRGLRAGTRSSHLRRNYTKWNNLVKKKYIISQKKN